MSNQMSEEDKQIYDRVYAEVNDEFHDKFANCTSDDEYVALVEAWNDEIWRRIPRFKKRLLAHQRDQSGGP